ncbi:MAG TPA: hypothetical protein VEV41_11515 [Terriglobales bacterium]|nr:hypothetical protein [Terriglobales bacterium]
MWPEAEMTAEMPIRAHLLPGQRAKAVRGLTSVEALGDYQQGHNENRCRAGHTQHLQNSFLGRSSLGYSFSKTWMQFFAAPIAMETSIQSQSVIASSIHQNSALQMLQHCMLFMANKRRVPESNLNTNEKQRGALLIAASLIAAIRLRGEPIDNSPKM